nr:hypothetical protein [Tanacetum cinerariifolium]
MTSLEHINNPTESMNAALILFAKAFQLSAPTNNNQRTSSNPRNRQIAQPVMNIVTQNQQGYNAWQNGGIQGAQNAGLRVLELGIKPGATTAEDWVILLGIALPGQGEGMLLIFRLSCSFLKRKKQGYNFKQKNLTSWLLQHDKAPVYDTDGSAEVQLNDNCYDNEIFNMFTQEEQYTDLLEPILEPQLVPQNANHVTSVSPSMVHSGGIVETSFAPNKETRAHQETIYRNLVDQVAHVNIVNRNMRATNAELKSELARYKIQEQHVKISQEKYDKLEVCYQHYDIMSIVQNGFVDAPSDLRTELDRMKEKLELCIVKKEKEYAVLWNNWYIKCEECKYDKISYDKAYNDMQQKVERLQAQLRDLKGKSCDTPSASNTLDPLNQKLESKIIELEFQVLRARGFENTSESMKNTSGTSVTPHVDKPKLSVVTPLSKKLHASMPTHSIPQPRESNVVKHKNVIAPRMFKINPSHTPMADLG